MHRVDLQDGSPSPAIVRAVYNCEAPVAVWFSEDNRLFQKALSSLFPGLIAFLEKHSVPHEKLLLSNEGHGIGHLAAEVNVMEQIEEFLRKNLAPKDVPDAAKAAESAASKKDKAPAL